MSFLGGAALSGGIGILSGLFQGIGAKNRQKEALYWQSKENQAARDWQTEMMKYQNEWNKKAVADAQNWQESMVDKQRSYDAAYNNPSAQMARLKAAGLNPDLMYGSGVGSMTATSSAGGSVSPMPSAGAGDYHATDYMSAIMGTNTVGESMLQGLSAAKIAADINQVEAQTTKTKGEVTSLDLDNIRKAATNGSMIELDNFQINLAKQTASLNDSQLQIMSQQLNNLKTENDMCNQQIQESMAKVANMDSQTLNNRISAFFASSRFDMEVKRFQQELKASDSQINLTNTEAKQILCLLTAQKLNLDADLLLKKANVDKVKTETVNLFYNRELLDVHGKTMHFNLEQSKKFDTVERVVNIGATGLNAVGSIIGGVTSVAKFIK